MLIVDVHQLQLFQYVFKNPEEEASDHKMPSFLLHQDLDHLQNSPLNQLDHRLKLELRTLSFQINTPLLIKQKLVKHKAKDRALPKNN